jgi:hypothetical protein
MLDQRLAPTAATGTNESHPAEEVGVAIACESTRLAYNWPFRDDGLDVQGSLAPD